jgi:hypothetical protein
MELIDVPFMCDATTMPCLRRGAELRTGHDVSAADGAVSVTIHRNAYLPRKSSANCRDSVDIR